MVIKRITHIPRPLSIAPMMEWTDRHYRTFIRLLTRHTLLYTEMITANALVHGDADTLMAFSPIEKPIAIQLGGDNSQDLCQAAHMAQEEGYDEVNLNVGCPSPKVQNGRFGACLMLEPDLVAEIVSQLKARVQIPVTVKHRIGVNDRGDYQDLSAFVSTVAQAGCDRFIIHARIALLKTLSPKENRSVPPLRYDDVYRLKTEYPDLLIDINGGIQTMDEVRHHLKYVDGVMLGRAAYAHPYRLAHADAMIFRDPRPIPSRRQVVESMLPYLQAHTGHPLAVLRHMLGFFRGMPGGRRWRQYITEGIQNKDPFLVLKESLSVLDQDLLDEPCGEYK
jgi:tRNA-dihydrouridine synthase A